MKHVEHQPGHVCKNWFQCDSCGEKVEERSHDEIYGKCFMCGGVLKAITYYRPHIAPEVYQQVEFEEVLQRHPSGYDGYKAAVDEYFVDDKYTAEALKNELLRLARVATHMQYELKSLRAAHNKS